MTIAKAPALQRLTDALRDHGSIVRESGDSFMAQCPAHPDNNPSLSLRRRRDDRGAVLKCHAGCEYTDVLAVLGLTESDLFDDDPIRDALDPIKTYVYANGRKNHRSVADGQKTFWQEGSSDKSLYAIDTVKPGDVVYLCEGEKAADFLRALGYTAVATGGSQRTCDIEPLTGHVVNIIADRDDAGRKWARRYEQMLKPVALYVCILQAAVDIDKADIVEHISAGYGVDELEIVPIEDRNGHEVSLVIEPDEPIPKPQLEDIEQGFWDSRESLQLIYTSALARMCSPWAVLACCAARALAIVRPTVTLPALIGGRGSLNWFAAIVAASGGGKGAAMAVAQGLIPEFVFQRNLGSGEGLVTAFQTKSNDEHPDGVRESVMFVADEIDSMMALGSRSGSTMMATLRSAFSGETIGFSYATKGRDIHLPGHTYRLTMICSVQPGRAGGLLADATGGTPQRFMWFPGSDKRISRKHLNRYDWSPKLTMPRLAEWLYPREVLLPDAAVDYIVGARESAMRGEADTLDAHAIFAREKIAYALTVMDGRTEMSLDDWELSGVVSNVSGYTRDQVVNAVRDAGRIDALERGELKGVELEASDAARKHEYAERVRRVLRRLLEKLREADETGLTNRELTKSVAHRDRFALEDVLRIAISDGLVKRDPSTGNWTRL